MDGSSRIFSKKLDKLTKKNSNHVPKHLSLLQTFAKEEDDHENELPVCPPAPRLRPVRMLKPNISREDTKIVTEAFLEFYRSMLSPEQ